MKRIIMATDLSARCDRALQRALALAHDLGAELKIIHVVDEAFQESITLRQETAAREAIAEQLRSQPLAKDVAVAAEVIRGTDYVDILRAAADFAADLVVLGIHRHALRELFQGTTAERVIRHGRPPVLVVKDSVVAPYRRALVPVDLSPHALAAMELAARIVPKCEVHLVHVAHRPFSAFLSRETQDQLISDERARIAAELDRQVQQLSARLGDAAPQFKIVLRDGEVRRVIREQVAVIEPDLLVVGTHGRSGIAQAIIGSVAEDLLADAPVDVLAVKAA